VRTDPKTIASAFYATLQQAWNDADGAAFGAAFDADASFVDIRGVAHDGASGIGADHQRIFDTIYKGSDVRYTLETAHALSDDVIVARGRATLDAPSGPLAGIHHAVNTIVFVRTADDWRGAAFHNTLITV
jgi:uncharacterized protein (TIGR02246 family)